MSMSEQQLDQAIAALPYPKVTKDSIEARIKSVEYLHIGLTVTVCSITMVNGFSFRGESACVDPRNFDVEIGKQLAYKDAFGKIWAFEGYLLADQRYREQKSIANYCRDMTFGGALMAMKGGKRVARAGWNGKGMWICIGDGNPALDAQQFWNPHTRAFAEENGGKAPVLPYIIMKTADGSVLMGWLASQSDMLADDWMVL